MNTLYIKLQPAAKIVSLILTGVLMAMVPLVIVALILSA
jgi:hypothetical protein